MTYDFELTEKVKKFCEKIGTDVLGFADPKLFDRFPKHNRPGFYLKESQTVIIIGIYLHDIVLDAWTLDQKFNKSFQFVDTILEKLLYQIKEFLVKWEYNSEIIPYTPGIFLKDAAALAGMGPIGRNNLLITEQWGSQVRLRSLTTTAPLKCGTPVLESMYCEKCNKCVEACPARAFGDGKYNKEKCYAYQISHLRKISDHTSIWCSICIEACPVGKNT